MRFRCGELGGFQRLRKLWCKFEVVYLTPNSLFFGRVEDATKDHNKVYTGVF